MIQILSILGNTNRSDLKILIGLTILWVLINVICIYHFGIVTGFESVKYIENANLLIDQGRYSSPQFYFYSVQILLIALAKYTGTFPVLPVIVQLIFNAYATFCFYRIIILTSGRKRVATCTTAVLISMVYFQLYNTHLFTESIYFSLSVIYCFKLFKIKDLRIIETWQPFCILFALYFTRPVGIFFLAATFAFITIKFFRKNVLPIIIIASVTFLFFLVLLTNVSLNIGGEFNFLLPYIKAHVICGVPTVNQPFSISVPVEKNSIQGLLYIIANYWDLYATLIMKRFSAFWGCTRPYFTFLHNLYLVLNFYTIYLLIFLGIRNWKSYDAPTITFCICVALQTMMGAILACDDWHNRFILSIFPFLLLLSTYAFRRSTRQKKYEKSNYEEFEKSLG